MTGRGRLRPVQAGRGAVMAGLLVLVSPGCGSAPSGAPGSTANRHTLAGRVLDLVTSSGIPVQDDRIGCAGALDGGSDVCTGLTATEPVQKITGHFTLDRRAAGATGGPTSGCPGKLLVTIGPSLGYLDSKGPVQVLTATREDPCR